MVNKNLIINNNKINYILKSKNSNGPKISVVFLVVISLIRVAPSIIHRELKKESRLRISQI